VSPLPPPAGGIGKWTVAVTESHLRDDYEIEVVSTSPSVTTSVSGGSRLRAARLRDALRINRRLIAALIRFRPHIVHVNTSAVLWSFLRNSLAVWLGRASGARVILHIRGGDFADWADKSGPATRTWIAATLGRCDRVIALTKPTQQWLEAKLDPAKTRYLPNFVTLSEVQDLQPREPRRERLEVLFVGWLIEAKGIRELLKAAAQVPEVHLTLVGPSEPEFVSTLARDVSALGARLRILPAAHRREIYKLYRGADVFVLPTHREGFPNVVLEAMAHGLPVVATPVGAIPEAIEDEVSGLLVPVRDPDRLAAALRRLAESPELRQRLGANARERVAREFEFDAVLARLRAIYADLEVSPRGPESSARSASVTPKEQ
jgi:glycosyltransferase involved in cell wall biosynthesis